MLGAAVSAERLPALLKQHPSPAVSTVSLRSDTAAGNGERKGGDFQRADGSRSVAARALKTRAALNSEATVWGTRSSGGPHCR